MRDDDVPRAAAEKWSQLSAMIAGTLGLHYPRERLGDLRRGVAAAAPEFGYTDPEACLDWLLSAPFSPSQLDVLTAHLTVGETYFFRDRGAFDVLSEHVLPSLIAARRGRNQRLRLWSAGCCTGDEAYSLAILLHQLLPDLAEWHVTILATDVNAEFLKRAVAGIYREWSFRGTSPEFKRRYFLASGNGRYQIRSEFKRLVKFEHLNLVADHYPSLATDTNAMDLILCRNVLMYFTAEQIGSVVRKLHSALVDGAWLLVSASETSQEAFGRFVTHTFPGVILYQKPHTAHAPAHARHEPRRASAAKPMAGRSGGIPRPPVIDSSRAECPPGANASEASSQAAVSRAAAATLYERGEYAEAADVLLVSCSGRTPASDELSLLTRALANAGKLAEAAAWCERWLETDTLNPAAHYLKAMVLLEGGAIDEARRSLQRAVYLDPQFVLAHFALGTLARSRGVGAEADRHFANTLRILGGRDRQEVLPESDGLTVERLTETVRALATSPGAR